MQPNTHADQHVSSVQRNRALLGTSRLGSMIALHTSDSVTSCTSVMLSRPSTVRAWSRVRPAVLSVGKVARTGLPCSARLVWTVTAVPGAVMARNYAVIAASSIALHGGAGAPQARSGASRSDSWSRCQRWLGLLMQGSCSGMNTYSSLTYTEVCAPYGQPSRLGSVVLGHTHAARLSCTALFANPTETSCAFVHVTSVSIGATWSEDSQPCSTSISPNAPHYN